MKGSLLAITVLMTGLLAGCGGKKPIAAGRLQQPAGAFSYVTPDGWYRTHLPGIDYIIVSTEPDSGSTPNLFVDFVDPSTSLREAAGEVARKYQGPHPSYTVSGEQAFTTTSGLSGIRITAQRATPDAVSLSTFHYLIQDTHRVIAVTASCAESVTPVYEPLFDAAMKSLETHRTRE
jgi:hypothetical protein